MDEDVGRLDVAVHNAMGVCVVEGARDWSQYTYDLLEVHRAAQTIRKRPALDQLRDQIGGAVFLAEIKDAEYVRVPQSSCRLRFLTEAVQEARVLGKEVGQDLDRNVSIERGVVGFVDGGHPAATDGLDDSVWTQVVAVTQAHRKTSWRGCLRNPPGQATGPGTAASRRPGLGGGGGVLFHAAGFGRRLGARTKPNRNSRMPISRARKSQPSSPSPVAPAALPVCEPLRVRARPARPEADSPELAVLAAVEPFSP